MILSMVDGKKSQGITNTADLAARLGKRRTNMKVLVKIYDGVKYFRGSEKVTEHTYTDVESWKVVGGKKKQRKSKKSLSETT